MLIFDIMTTIMLAAAGIFFLTVGEVTRLQFGMVWGLALLYHIAFIVEEERKRR